MAPATQPALIFTQLTQGPVAALLVYADKVRPLSGNELGNEISRLGEPGEQPLVQMQLAMLLAQTRSPADLARALGLLQRVIANPANEAQALHPLARLLAARYQEQRRVEEDRDRQAQQLRDSQRRIEQLTDRIEALRAIERSFSRPNNPPPVAPAAPKPAP
jgi:DNA repair ATPase RecN